MTCQTFTFGQSRVCVIAPDSDDWNLVYNGSGYELFWNNRVVALLGATDKQAVIRPKNWANAPVFIDGAQMPDTSDWWRLSDSSVIQLAGGSVLVTTLGVVAEFLCGDTSRGLYGLAHVAHSDPEGPVAEALNLWHAGLRVGMPQTTPLVSALYETIGTLVGYQVDSEGPADLDPDGISVGSLLQIGYFNRPAEKSIAWVRVTRKLVSAEGYRFTVQVLDDPAPWHPNWELVIKNESASLPLDIRLYMVV